MCVADNWQESDSFKEEFKVLKSGDHKGAISSKWHRNNCGWVGIRCPKCGGWIQNYKGENEKLCQCGWIKDYSGFRHRYILEENE